MIEEYKETIGHGRGYPTGLGHEEKMDVIACLLDEGVMFYVNEEHTTWISENQCRVSGTGHIRLRLRHKKHTGGKWINRDPAAVADTTSGNVRSIWCEDGNVIAIDPSWIFTDLYSS